MTPALREQVRRRAGHRCEYCQLPQSGTSLPHEADHIRAQKHRGSTVLDNLCWACARCNSVKGSDVSGYDPVTDCLIPLFNPRKDTWEDHFEGYRAVLVGKTETGRATVELLQINLEERVVHRRLLVLSGEAPDISPKR